MLWTWVPGLGWHIIKQTAKSWSYFIIMGVIFWFLPVVVAVVLGTAPTTRVGTVLKNHFLMVVGGYVFMLMGYQAAGAYWRKRRQRIVNSPELEEMVAVLSERAGFPQSPTIVVTDGQVNAAASATLSERFLILMGGIEHLLTTRAAMGVIGHELAHLKHRDNFATMLIHAGAHVLKLQTYLVGFVCAMSIFFYQVTHAGETRYLLKMVALLFALQLVYQLLSLAFTRAREYLADIGAIGITTPDFRDEIIHGILSVGAAIDGHRRHPFEYFRQRSDFWFLQTHPSLADRAAALGVTVHPNGRGVVLIETPLT